MERVKQHSIIARLSFDDIMNLDRDGVIEQCELRGIEILSTPISTLRKRLYEFNEAACKEDDDEDTRKFPCFIVPVALGCRLIAVKNEADHKLEKFTSAFHKWVTSAKPGDVITIRALQCTQKDWDGLSLPPEVDLTKVCEQRGLIPLIETDETKIVMEQNKDQTALAVGTNLNSNMLVQAAQLAALSRASRVFASKITDMLENSGIDSKLLRDPKVQSSISAILPLLLMQFGDKIPGVKNIAVLKPLAHQQFIINMADILDIAMGDVIELMTSVTTELNTGDVSSDGQPSDT